MSEYSFTMPACPTCGASRATLVSAETSGTFKMRCTSGHVFTVTPT